MSPNVAVRLVDVHKNFRTGAQLLEALRGVSLEITQGEMVALVGPSGCGKSTLLNLIGCIDYPTSGYLEIQGTSTGALGDDLLAALRRERIGIVFQFFNLLPTLTVGENVRLPLLLNHRGVTESTFRVMEVLERVGILDKAEAYPTQLSGGQLQRAAVARAIIHQPAIVLADEPTGNLDSRSGAGVLTILREIASAGQTILMVTHSSEAAALCDRTVSIRDGQIVAAN